MASTVQMNLGMARSWQGEIEGLNSRLQQELTGVNESVAAIGQDAAGSVVGQLAGVEEVVCQHLVDAVTEGIAKVGKFFI